MSCQQNLAGNAGISHFSWSFSISTGQFYIFHEIPNDYRKIQPWRSGGLAQLAFRHHLSVKRKCVNLLSISFQGWDRNIFFFFFVADDRGEACIHPFIHKLDLWHCTLGKGSFASFLKQKECTALSTDNIHPSCHCQSLEWTAAESIFHNEIPMGVTIRSGILFSQLTNPCK